MGLKNKNSIFDLVAGNNPVEDMANQQGPVSQLPINVASQVHIDSLQIVPGGTQNSPFQDLNGNPGPQFQQPVNIASQVHIDSLQVVPGGVQNSPHQDLNGLPDPDFNTLSGTSDSPFQSATGDHMVDLLTQNATSTNTGQTYDPSIYDLNGNPDPLFNTLGGINDSPFQNPNPATATGDHMVDLLAQNVISTNTGMTYDSAPNQSPYQDLNGNPGPQFQLPTAQASQKHIDSLTQQSSYQHGNSVEVVGPSLQDLDGNPGPSFDLGDTSTLQQDSLLSVPQPPSNSPYQDLDGNPGPPFDNGISSTLQQDSLISLYQYNHGNSSEETGPSTLDLNGNPGQLFDNGISSTLKQDLLVNVYQSGVNPGASYGAGQPGGTWPSVNPSPLASTPFADLNGTTPSQYLNNLPG